MNLPVTSVVEQHSFIRSFNISLVKQQFVVIDRYSVLQEAGRKLDRPSVDQHSSTSCFFTKI